MLPDYQPPSLRPDASQGMTIAQLILSGLGLVVSLLASAGLAIYGMAGLFGSKPDLQSATATFSVAAIFLLAALLAIPSLVSSFRRWSGREPLRPMVSASTFRLASYGLVLWALVVGLGSLISRSPQIAWLVLPPLQLLTIGLPIWWIFEFARRGLSIGSAQRGWGILNFGIFITTPVLMIIEIVVLLGLVVAFAVWASQNRMVMAALAGLSEAINQARGNPQALLPILMPYLQNPLTIFAVLAIIAGLMPMIEELFKPLALWVLAGRRLTPAQGFVGGALCGAAFALIESLFYLSMPMGESWAALAVGRTGTCLLHITTTALVGWAMAEAWQNGAYLRLGATYLLAVALHGLWNGLSIISGLTAFLSPAPANLKVLMSISRVAPFAIAALLVLLFALLWESHHKLLRYNRPADVESAAESDQWRIS